VVVTIHANLNEGNTGETSRELFKLILVETVIQLPDNLGRLVGGRQTDFVTSGRLVLRGTTKRVVTMLLLAINGRRSISSGMRRVGSSRASGARDRSLHKFSSVHGV
jgi:hypothetical protein